MAADAVEAGRYLAIVAGCNDCHTAGYLQQEGRIPEDEWLAGSAMGWRGPWGTTYATNLRLRVQEVSEDEWVRTLHTRTARPPMPWMNVNRMSERDARALYRYIRALGPKGEPMPAPVPPGQEPATPYLSLMPQNLPQP
ncbi:c-type cytochrome [Rhodocaloribacter litoris]|uniref:c-type cytochrome n=1 Tax=Rhodocaloribacter litoris TaxID=2558931 RepID=UPI0014238ED5|nr:c-type cytochrome [Rhodocaloribacter litoris]QXD15200.1 c-type cytochrome [Rhodocaloribacter litoris]